MTNLSLFLFASTEKGVRCSWSKLASSSSHLRQKVQLFPCLFYPHYFLEVEADATLTDGLVHLAMLVSGRTGAQRFPFLLLDQMPHEKRIRLNTPSYRVALQAR